MPRGRPKGTRNKPKPSIQLNQLKPTDLREFGHEIERTSRRYRHYAYNKRGEKYHTLIDKANPDLSFRAIPESQYQAHLKRLAKGQYAYDKLWLYGKEGTQWRMENSRKGIISRIENEFNIKEYYQNRNIIVNVDGKQMTVGEILDKLENLENSQRWIDYSEKYGDFITESWEEYKSESGLAPPETAGTQIKGNELVSEIDSSVASQESQESLSKFLKSLKDYGLI